MTCTIDKVDVKRLASGHWGYILPAVAGIPAELLDTRHHECPKCGGRDRFRALDDFVETGAVFCNQCFDKREKGNKGDGVSAVEWLLGISFQAALEKINYALGGCNNHTPTASKPRREVATFATLDAAIADAERYRGTKSAQWDYRDNQGKLVGAAVRWDRNDGSKVVIPFSSAPSGWANCAMPEPCPLYQLPELIDAVMVVVNEGEKAAEAARGLGYVATTSPGGSKAAGKADWSPVAGKMVVICPDNDNDGESYVADLVAIFSELSPLPSVKVVRLPDLPHKGDIYDFATKRRSEGRTDQQIREEIDQLIAEAPWVLNPPVELIANYDMIEASGEDERRKKSEKVAKPMGEIIDSIGSCMGGWPRRVDNVLFVDDTKHGLDFFDRRGVASLFGWLRRHSEVDWVKGSTFVTQAELFAELERTARRYDHIEALPHEPLIENIYYQSGTPTPGDGKHLRELIDRFRPETTIDRDLIQAAFMTPFWGGAVGCRPAFVITSDAGRGVGKSKLAELIAHLAGGHLDVSLGESIGTLKERFLSPQAMTKRVAILDNVKTMKLSWAELEGFITAPVISGKRMYVGEGQRPNHVVWLITLNGVNLATDMAQRSIIIKLVRGDNSDSWYEDTRDFIDRHRSKLIADIVGALRAERFDLRQYTRWASWERDVLCRLPEPTEAQRVISERQGAANAEHDEAEIIQDYFTSQLEKIGYRPLHDQVRIPVEVVARWYCTATNDKVKTPTVSKHLGQMSAEGQLPRLTKDSTRTYGRCFIWTGEYADVERVPILNDLPEKLAELQKSLTKDTQHAQSYAT